MTSGQKIAFSLLAAFALFAVFVMSLHSTLFKELETRFYAQAKIEENTGQLDKISESCDSYISEILSFVEKGDNAWTKNASVRSYYVQNPSESDVNVRRRLTENLFSELSALNGIRIVDKNGRNVHYSSFDDTDLLKQSGISKFYKNYTDIIKDSDEIPFEKLQKITSETKSVILYDESRSRLILSVPFCWVDGIYSGTALFYLNLHEVEKELTRREVLSIGQEITLFADEDYNGGFALNIPRINKNEFQKPLLSYWKTRSEIMSRGQDAGQEPEKLLSIPDGRFYVGLSSNRIGKIRIAGVYTSDIFELSAQIRVLIYICIFISILLIVFLVFSFIRDPMVTLKKRIKKIQLEIIENYIDGKEKREWSDVARHLRQRRNDLSDEIIKSLHVHSRKRRKEISEYLEKNWDEIFAIFETKAGSGENPAPAVGGNTTGAAELTGASIAEIRRMLEEVLANRNLLAPVAAGAVAGAAVVAAKTSASADDVDELDEVEELAEDVDEIDEIDEVDEVEDLAEDIDEADEVEDLAEEADEIDEVEELAEDAEEEVLDEAADADEVDELEEPVEEAAEEEVLDEVEELSEEADESEEVELPAEETEQIDELEEPVEEAEEEVLDEVEELEEDDEIETLDEEEELDVLEEYVEPPASNIHDDVEAYIKSLVPPEKKYAPSNETYFVSEKFADVENLFAEELKLGNVKPYHLDYSKPIELTIYTIPEYSQPAAEVPVKNLTEKDAAGFVPPETKKPEEELSEDVIDEVSQEEIVEDVVEDIVVEAPQEEIVEEVVEEAPQDEIIEDIIEEAPVEELTEEIPSYLPEPDFSMTAFGDNLSDEVPELQEENVIIEQDDGVFSIAEDLEYTDVVQDADFKHLVDSVL